MLKVKYYIIDGCEYTRSKEYERIFKNEKELEDYITSCWHFMDEVKIIEKEYISE